jgi:curved DNA-binding protein
MQFKDYYRLMGISATATPDEIKIAYRKLARKFHPDVNKEPSAQKSFTDVGEANEVLKDPVKRAAYDELRAAGWKEGQEMEVPPVRQQAPRQGPTGFGEAGDFSDFFQSFYGHAGSGRSAGSGRAAFHERGDDIHATLTVTLEESYRGGERQFTLQNGAEDAPRAGQRTITVKIPKGVTSGSKVRLRGQGRPGATAELHGDLYLEIELAEHRLFQIDGRDLILDVPLAPWEAVLGARIAVPSLGGTVTATIPSGAQPQQKLRLKGLGLPGDPPGDQYLTLSITVPPTASEKAKALYRELAEESAFDPRRHFGA